MSILLAVILVLPLSGSPASEKAELLSQVHLPAPLPGNVTLAPKGNVTVIVSMAGYAEEVPWVTITSWLGEWHTVGANVLVLWPVWQHISPVDTISAETAKGRVQLKLDRYISYWNPKSYLKPDPERGSEAEFLEMIRSAHSFGLRVVPILQMGYTLPGSFVYEEHPEWILKARSGSYAVGWPWAIANWGYTLDKSNPALLSYVTNTILPHWTKNWGVDGIWLDAPIVKTCEGRTTRMAEAASPTSDSNFACLTPVDGSYTAEPLARVLRSTTAELAKETGRKLVLAGENPIGSYSDVPEEYIEALLHGQTAGYIPRFWNDQRIVGPLGKYWDWVCDYRFREILRNVFDKGSLARSDKFVGALIEERNLANKDTEPARFVNQINNYYRYDPLLNPAVAECYITLAITAPGRVVWFEGPEVTLTPETAPRKNAPPEPVLKTWYQRRAILHAWYKRLITIKKALPALQSANIEDALLNSSAPQLIAFNRWEGRESATIIVNAGDAAAELRVKTRFDGKEVHVLDLLHAERVAGNPADLKIEMPAHSARALVLEKN